MILKCLAFLALCQVALSLHKPLCSKTDARRLLLVDAPRDDYYEGKGLRGRLLQKHGHGHKGLFGSKCEGEPVFGFKGPKCGGCGGCSECDVGTVIVEHGHGGLGGCGAIVGVKPSPVIVEKEASDCGVIVEAAPQIVHQEACLPKIVGDTKPVRLVHHAQPFLIQSHEKPLIIDHYKQAIVTNHNPQPVILDHLMEPTVSIGFDHGSSGCVPEFHGHGGKGHAVVVPEQPCGCGKPGCGGCGFSGYGVCGKPGCGGCQRCC